MSDRWSGVYLKENKENVESALTRLAESRGYTLLLRKESVGYPLAEESELKEIFKKGLSKNIDVVFLLKAHSLWTRMIGFEQVDTVHPRLFFNSELVVMLGCDAFECGFINTLSWWYVYYEQGKVIDRFDTEPIETIVHPLYDQPLDPNDLRTIFFKCMGIKEWQYTPLPSEILAHYQGNPERLAPILIDGNHQILEGILEEETPEKAIARLGEASELPYIGQYLSIDLFSSLSNRLVTPDPETLEITRQGMTLLVLQHPKMDLEFQIE